MTFQERANLIKELKACTRKVPRKTSRGLGNIAGEQKRLKQLAYR